MMWAGRAFIWLIAVTLCVAAGVSRAQVYSNWQVDSLIQEFYPDRPAGCGDAKEALQISLAAGEVVVRPRYESDDGLIVSHQGDAAMTFMLGPAGCRIGAAIGKDVSRAGAGVGTVGTGLAWTPVLRGGDRQAFTQAYYEASNSACEPAKIYLRVSGGNVFLEVMSKPMHEPRSDHVDAAPLDPHGPLHAMIGRPGCKIGFLVFKVD
jgi:hypothetical protein